MIHLNPLHHHILHSKRETSTNTYAVMSAAKITVHVFPSLTFQCTSSVNPHSIFYAKRGFALVQTFSKSGPKSLNAATLNAATQNGAIDAAGQNAAIENTATQNAESENAKTKNSVTQILQINPESQNTTTVTSDSNYRTSIF